MSTEKLGLTELAANQAQPHLPINTTFRRLDALVQPNAIAFTADPPGSPADGDVHIVGSPASGIWAGQENKVAYRVAEAWTFVTPQVGWKFYIQSEGADWVFEGGSPGGWALFSAGGGGGGGGGSSTFFGLSDVDVTNLHDGYAVVYNQTTGKVEFVSIAAGGTFGLGDLSDVALGSPAAADNDVLTFNAGTGKWGAEASTGGAANVTPDIHPSSPSTWNDEFEGAALDTSGGRASGAQPWTIETEGTNTHFQVDGSLVLKSAASAQSFQFFSFPVPSGNWRFRLKLAVGNATGQILAGFMLYNTSNDHFTQIGLWGGGSQTFAQFNQTGPLSGSSFSSTPWSVNIVGETQRWTDFSHLELEYDGTNLITRGSRTGIDGTFTQLGSVTLASWVGVISKMGLHLNNSGTAQLAIFEWLRRMA